MIKPTRDGAIAIIVVCGIMVVAGWQGLIYLWFMLMGLMINVMLSTRDPKEAGELLRKWFEHHVLGKPKGE